MDFLKTKKKTEKSLQKVEQIAIPLQESKKEVYYNVKRKVNRFGIFFGVIPYWKNIINVCAMITSLLTVLVSILMLTQYYSRLPNKIPLFFYQTSKSWSLTDKELLIALPVFAAVLLILLSRLNEGVFKFDRRLSLVINISVCIFNIFFIIAILELFSLVLVF